jgi:Flp pilus assembly protein TadG
VAEEALRGESVEAPAPGRLPRPRHCLRAVRGDQRGQALVEFALVALPLFLIIFGIIDFARALNYYNDLTQLAGQGARAAAVNANPNGSAASGKSIQTGVYNNLDSPEMKQAANHAHICITTMPATTGDPVTVRATYTFHFIPLIHPVAITLSSSQTERFEGVSPSYSGGCSS